MNFPVSTLSTTGNSLTSLADQIKKLAAEAESINASLANSYDQGGVGGKVGAIAAAMKSQASSLSRYGHAAAQANSVYSNASAGLGLAVMQAGGFIAAHGSGKGSTGTDGAIVEGNKPEQNKDPRKAAEVYTAGGGGFSKGGGGNGSFSGGDGSAGGRGETDYSKMNEFQKAGHAMKRFEKEYDKLPEFVRDGVEEAFGGTAVEAWDITSDILNNEVDLDTLDSALGTIGVDSTVSDVITKSVDFAWNPDSIQKDLCWGKDHFIDQCAKQLLDGNYAEAAKSFGMSAACGLTEIGYGVVKVPVSIATDMIMDAGKKASSILDSLSGLFK